MNERYRLLEYLNGRTYSENPTRSIEWSLVEKYLSRDSNLPIKTCVSKGWYSDIAEEKLKDIIDNIPGSKIFVEQNIGEGYVKVLVDNKSLLGSFIFIYQQGIVRQAYVSVYGDTILPKVFEEYLEKCGFSHTLAEENKVQLFYCFSAPNGKASFYARNFSRLGFNEIHNNYALSVQNQVGKLITSLRELGHGLVILHGPVGTGKTYLIRALLSEISQNRTGVICSPPSEFLAIPSLLSQAILEIDRPIVILEDTGEMFQEDSKSRFQDQFSNLANYTDGLMSLMSEAIFLLTFNYDIRHIDPALVRAGRCIANIEVPLLSSEQASQLAGKELEKGNYSLADLYAMKNNKMPIVKSKLEKLGFSTIERMKQQVEKISLSPARGGY